MYRSPGEIAIRWGSGSDTTRHWKINSQSMRAQRASLSSSFDWEVWWQPPVKICPTKSLLIGSWHINHHITVHSSHKSILVEHINLQSHWNNKHQQLYHHTKSIYILSTSTMSLFESCVQTHGADLSTNLLECVADGTEAVSLWTLLDVSYL